MYLWSKLSFKDREDLLQIRKDKGHPLHSPPNFDIEPGLYLVTAACYQHQPFIGYSENRLANFEQMLLQHLHQCVLEIHAWCVLLNHYHVMVFIHCPIQIRKDLGQFHGRVSKCWNLEENLQGRQVWYRSMPRKIKSEGHYWATMNYIHHNPVKHGLCNRWLDWSYSSAQVYLNKMGRDRAIKVWKQYPIDQFGNNWDYDF